MYRSQGELRSYARRVFALYATDGALSISKFRLAWCVLWGIYPDDHILQTFFCDRHDYDLNGASFFPKLASDQTGCTESYDRAQKPFLTKSISEEKFLRAVVTYHDTLGPAAGMPSNSESNANGYKFSFFGSHCLANSLVLQRVLFESLAGSKGYATLDDLLAGENVDWLRASEDDGDGDVCAPSDGDKCIRLKGRAALLSHAFAIADRDGDGRLVFSDLETFLRPSSV